MNTQEWLAVITLLIAIVGAIQTIVVSYFGRAARSAALDASTTSSTAAAQMIANSGKIDEVKRIVNGQTSDLLAHNQALEEALRGVGVMPPPPPPPTVAPPPDVTPEPPTGG